MPKEYLLVDQATHAVAEDLVLADIDGHAAYRAATSALRVAVPLLAPQIVDVIVTRIRAEADDSPKSEEETQTAFAIRSVVASAMHRLADQVAADYREAFTA